MNMTPEIKIASFVAEQEIKTCLRFITCGSVDDGKSTLLGRLLYDSKTVFQDQLGATKIESKKYGTQGDNIDLALLVDGLQAEREQGITIDVAYRYFETDKRKFIAADTPGHEQYTRNMATGASTADLAIILIDASKGLLTQTRRHSYIISLLGIKSVVLAVNKMDRVGYQQNVFDEIVSSYETFAQGLQYDTITAIPVSALTGENVFTRATAINWYSGPTLMTFLEDVEINDQDTHGPLRLPVQWVNRPNVSFRGYCGSISAGNLTVGQKVAATPSGKQSTIKEILGPSGPLAKATARQAVTVTLNDEIDISRGDVIYDVHNAPEITDQFAAHILWMDIEPMLPERRYRIQIGHSHANAQVTDLVHSVNVNTLEHTAAKTLELNEVGYCKVALDRALSVDAYASNRQTGSFILVDKYTNSTAALGVIDFSLRRATNIEWHEMEINKASRAAINQQKPCVLWFTGLSGSGKSTVADRLEQKLSKLGKRTYILDGDNVRHGLSKDLGFSDQDRVENIRRIAEVSKLMVDAGMIVITSFISPFNAERKMARALLDEGEFIEVFVDTSIEVCEQRDPKGLYKKARSGELKNFTGIDSDFDIPENPELILDGGRDTVDDLAEQVLRYLDLD